MLAPQARGTFASIHGNAMPLVVQPGFHRDGGGLGISFLLTDCPQQQRLSVEMAGDSQGTQTSANILDPCQPLLIFHKQCH